MAAVAAKNLGWVLVPAIVVVGAIVYCPAPWIAILLAVATLLVAAAWRSGRDAAKIVLGNVAAVLVALAAFEGYLALRPSPSDGTRMEGTITEDFTHRDDLLGYAPGKGMRVTARKFESDALLYDVTYSIGPDGLRVTPAPAPAAVGCIVLFGDSVTFGEGVNDDEAFAYRVAALTDGRFAVRNFAFSGYGPHQMLSMLEARMVQATPGCRPSQFVYLAILEHIGRVAGLASWDRHGPRYRLDGSGAPVRDGNFDTPPRLPGGIAMPVWLVDLLGRFRTWQQFAGSARSPNEADLQLFLAIVTQSARLARTTFPGSRFDVILWDGRDDRRLATIEAALDTAGIKVHRITAAIPDFPANASQYLLSSRDGHPNARMHGRLAEYVATGIAGR